jgi:hypothetical protein
MRRVIVIVARDQRDLHEYLKRGFEGVEGVEVILDRRVHLGAGERHPTDPERRKEIETHEELQLRGFIIRPAGG